MFGGWFSLLMKNGNASSVISTECIIKTGWCASGGISYEILTMHVNKYAFNLNCIRIAYDTMEMDDSETKTRSDRNANVSVVLAVDAIHRIISLQSWQTKYKMDYRHQTLALISIWLGYIFI